MSYYKSRRRFPSLYQAWQLYGDKVFFSVPFYEKENQCPWCGGEVNNKRRRFARTIAATNMLTIRRRIIMRPNEITPQNYEMYKKFSRRQ